MSDLERDLAAVLNRHSAENDSNTPDFLLAQYLLGCLATFNAAVMAREKWWGRDEPFVGECSDTGTSAWTEQVLSEDGEVERLIEETT